MSIADLLKFANDETPSEFEAEFEQMLKDRIASSDFNFYKTKTEGQSDEID